MPNATVEADETHFIVCKSINKVTKPVCSKFRWRNSIKIEAAGNEGKGQNNHKIKKKILSSVSAL